MNGAPPVTESAGHLPVMRTEMLEALAPCDGGLYLDGTFGGGGYSTAILAAARCQVVALDRDPAAIARGTALRSHFLERLRLIEGRFGEMASLLPAHGIDALDGVALDLGASSFQLDEPARGFSFRADGPLDMRMSACGESAADLVNGADEATLAQILRDFGEERRARAIARAIVERRREAPILTTGAFAALVRSVVGRGTDGLDPATRSFQALRIAVNDELGELTRGLAGAERLLRPKGRLVVISFHSLEDRCVKRFLNARGRPPRLPSRHQPVATATKSPQPSFTLLTLRALRPTSEECAYNPRARSARLRAAERTAARPFAEREAA
jgi:16S rRNA (cytosine1402-N4)-methyltransferase